VSEFQRRRAALYAEFPKESAEYESEYNELAAQLAEATALVTRAWKYVPLEHKEFRRDVALFLKPEDAP
jgi:hypothetical protein